MRSSTLLAISAWLHTTAIQCSPVLSPRLDPNHPPPFAGNPPFNEIQIGTGPTSPRVAICTHGACDDIALYDIYGPSAVYLWGELEGNAFVVGAVIADPTNVIESLNIVGQAIDLVKRNGRLDAFAIVQNMPDHVASQLNDTLALVGIPAPPPEFAQTFVYNASETALATIKAGSEVYLEINGLEVFGP